MALQFNRASSRIGIGGILNWVGAPAADDAARFILRPCRDAVPPPAVSDGAALEPMKGYPLHRRDARTRSSAITGRKSVVRSGIDARRAAF